MSLGTPPGPAAMHSSLSCRIPTGKADHTMYKPLLYVPPLQVRPGSTVLSVQATLLENGPSQSRKPFSDYSMATLQSESSLAAQIAYMPSGKETRV